MIHHLLKSFRLFFAILPLFVVAQTPPADLPQITGSWVNNGNPQRSMIQAIGVRFDRNVAGLIDQGSLKVRNIGSGAMVDLSGATLRFDPTNNSASWILPYDPADLIPDGNYIAWFEVDGLLGNRERAACALTATPLDEFVFAFHQFTGDSDGDRDVDFRDSCVLRETWLQQLGNNRYLSYFDFNLSSVVEESDRLKVATTYFSIFPAVPAVHLFLRNDTGTSFSDNATSLYSFGFGSTATDGMTWRASLNSGQFVDITSLVSGGKAILDEALINQLHGGALSVGTHTLRVEASDGSVVASDELAFEYLGDVACPPYFITTPPPGVSLGQVRPAQPLNLSDWTIVTYPDAQATPIWRISDDGLTATQLLNARPSALLSPDSLLNLRVTGTFRAGTGFDDDFMGFIFGYQNSKQFYLFDWKSREQDYVGGTALRGMTLKRIDAGDRDVTIADLWWSHQDRENTKILSPPNDIPWVPGQDYQITLEFTPGRIVVEVVEEGVILDRLVAEDDTFTGGRFGFYNASQDNVVYSGFTQERLDNTYYYDSEAEDPESQPLTYSLVPALNGTPPPATAVINANNGTVLWQPTEAGVYPFSLVVTDADGLTDRQDFDVTVTPVDLPPTVVIRKTASSVFPGEEVGISAEGTDDQQIFRTRLFIDDVEVNPNSGLSVITTTRSFSGIGLVELRALAVDSADQVTEAISFIRVLDPNMPPPANPNQTTVPGAGDVPGNPTDLRPLASFQAPLSPSDDSTRFVATVDANGGTLANWYLEWAPASSADINQLTKADVLWQVITQGTNTFTASEISTITPTNFPNELIVFRLRAENANGLGTIAAISFNPRSTTNTTATQTTGGGSGARPSAAFTAPLSAADDVTMVRGTVNASGGTLRNWVLDYAPRTAVDLTDLNNTSVAWTFISRGTSELSDGVLATLNPSLLPNAPLVFRLTATNENELGTVAGIVFNPSATTYGGPDGSTGITPSNSARPVAKISSPRSASDSLDELVGTVLANGGTLDRYIVDYALVSAVNPSNLSDPSVSWTELSTGTSEKTAETITPLTDPVFDNGRWVIRLRAFNTNGLGSLASTTLDSGDRSTPTTAFTSPDPETDITYLTDIRGTVSQENGVLDYWVLEYASTEQVGLTNLNANADWVEIGRGTSPVTDALLGTLDPTLLRNGSYILRLKAFNTSGRGFADGLLVLVCGEAKLGNFRMEFTDISVPLSGIPIKVTRIYDSLDTSHQGDFGFGWTLSIAEADITETVPDTGADFYSATPFKVGTRVFITAPSGERIGFTFKVRDRRNSFIYTSYAPYFEPDPGVRETLRIAPRNYERVELGDDDSVYEIGLPFGYNPDYYVLTTLDGNSYEYYQRGGLQKISDANGNLLSFSRSGISHSDGTSVQFNRDSSGRITSITDPSGKSIVYEYDTRGRLRFVTDRTGGKTEFIYGSASRPNFLTEIIDPRGVSAVRSEYDTDGRLIRQTDPKGNSVGFSYDPVSMTQTTTDRLGYTSTQEFDTLGNVVRMVDKDGGVTEFEYYPGTTREKLIIGPTGNAFSRAFDSKGNLIAETDGAAPAEDPANPSTGSTTRYSFDSNNNPTEITDPLGNVTRIAYDGSSGNITTFTSTANDGGDVTAINYQGSGEIRTIEDPAGNTTTFTYIRRGEPGFDDGGLAEVTKIADSEMRASSGTLLRRVRTYLDAGQLVLRKVTFRTLPGGGVDEVTLDYEYNDEGDLLLTIQPDGRIDENRYDSAGQITDTLVWRNRADYDSANDSLARKTNYQRDASGNVTRITLPDSSTVNMVYDAENRKIEEIGQLGHSTKFEYNGEGQLRFTIYPDSTPGSDADNPRSEIVYDAAGRETDIIDELGNRTEILYNSIGQESARIQHLAGGTTLTTIYAYAADGSLTSVTSPSGTSTQVVYDSRGRSIGNQFPSTSQHGATATETKYDSLGRVIQEIDVEGRGKQYTYDGLSRLTKVEYLDSSGNPLPDSTASYEYDEMGNETARTYGGNRRTEFTYDTMGRRTSRTLPGGSAETFSYDVYGQLIAHTDFTGFTTTYSYDDLGLLTEIVADPTHPSLSLAHAPARITFTYNADGSKSSSTIFNSSSAVLHTKSMSYDERGRLIEADGTSGKLSYGYFANDLLASTKSDSATGIDLTYSYDAANRLTRVTDATSGSSDYTYDVDGSLIGVVYPNGISHNYQYDTLNRLTNLTIRDNASTIMESFAYLLNPRGDRAQELRSDGRKRDFVYDEYYRLMSETVTGGPTIANGQITYSFDQYGNRTARASTISDLLTQSFTYDVDDRIVGDSYDGNGNTLSSTNIPSDFQGTDIYDFRNRLIRRTKAGGVTVDCIYDAEGNRTRKVVTTGGGTSVTNYLVDENSLTGYAQVVEERAAGGGLESAFIFGHDLISRRTPAGPPEIFYLYDGGGSVVGVANASGTILESYTYDGFGNPLDSPVVGMTDYRYRGEQLDPDLGLYYLRQRFSNPVTGRFWTADRFEGFKEEPMSLHRYLYTHANPVSNTDPSGMFTLVSLQTNFQLQINLRNVQAVHISKATGILAKNFLKVAAAFARQYLDFRGFNSRQVKILKARVFSLTNDIQPVDAAEFEMLDMLYSRSLGFVHASVVAKVISFVSGLFNPVKIKFKATLKFLSFISVDLVKLVKNIGSSIGSAITSIADRNAFVRIIKAAKSVAEVLEKLKSSAETLAEFAPVAIMANDYYRLTDSIYDTAFGR